MGSNRCIEPAMMKFNATDIQEGAPRHVDDEENEDEDDILPRDDEFLCRCLRASCPFRSRFHCTSNNSIATGGGIMEHASILCACIALSTFFFSMCMSNVAV